MSKVDVIFDYTDAPTLRDFSNSRMSVKGIVGPFGSGKSSACIWDIIQIGREQTPGGDGVSRTRWAVVRNTYRQLSDTTMKTVFDWFPPGRFGEYKVTEHQYIIDKIPAENGNRMEIEVLFRALDRPDHVKNLLSMELTGAWVNEVREIPRVIFDTLDGRTGRYPAEKDGGCRWSGMICDTNPPDTDHWFYKLFEEQLPNDPEMQKKYQLFRQPSGLSEQAENRTHLPPNYYERMMVGKSPEFVKVYIEGEYGYVQDGKPVYANYSDQLHLATDPIKVVKGTPLIIAFDFGLTPAVVFCQQLRNGKFNVVSELQGFDMGIRRFVRDFVKPYIFAEFPGIPIFATGDPAGMRRADSDESTGYMELRALGINAKPAPTNSFAARFNAVDVLLMRLVEGKPAFQLDPRCKILRKGFLGHYKFRRLQVVGQDRYVDAPEKNDASHLHDALQYAALVADQGINQVRNVFGTGYYNASKSDPSMEAWT